MLEIDSDFFDNTIPNNRSRVISDCLKNVNWQFGNGKIEILGSKSNYLSSDQDLMENISHFNLKPNQEAVKNYHHSYINYDLCFEDSWTLLFINNWIRENDCKEICILHIDDHSDLMNPLLDFNEGKFKNLISNKELNLNDSSEISEAINSGAIGIGNFFSPLFFMLESIDFRHLNNSSEQVCYSVIKSRKKIPVLKDTRRITIRLKSYSEGLGPYIYHGTQLLDELLRKPSKFPTIVHVDLDYFINSFDGGNRILSPDEEAIVFLNAKQKLLDLENYFIKSDLKPVRWIIATSPGFCASKYWVYLIENLEKIIEFSIAKPSSE